MPDAAADRPRTWRYTVPVEPAEAELVAAQLWAAGATGVWERAGTLTAWFPAAPDGSAPDGSAPDGGAPDGGAPDGRSIPGDGTWEPEAERDWQAAWKATISPVRAGRFVVVPSWLVDTEPLADDEVALVLDPGQAFGSGHHATTALCLELLDDLEVTGARVADVGCGTGVLAIAAARRGAQVEAVDLDPDAVEVSRRNAAANGVGLDLAVGSVERLTGPAEVVLANLVTDVVVRLAPELVAATRGTLIVSGVATERRGLAEAALTAAGLTVDEVRERDGWVALRGHPAGGPGSDAGAEPAGRPG